MNQSMNAILTYVKNGKPLKLLGVVTSFAALLLAATQAVAQMSIQVDDRGIFIESDRGLKIDYYRDRFQRTNRRSRFDFSRRFPMFDLNFPQFNSFARPTEPNRVISQTQETSAITVDSENLDLDIWSDRDAEITGEIWVDGVLVKTIRGNGTSLPLSPYLYRGKNTIEITGYYTPADSTIHVEVSGYSNTITHETSGSGTLQQTLILDVR